MDQQSAVPPLQHSEALRMRLSAESLATCADASARRRSVGHAVRRTDGVLVGGAAATTVPLSDVPAARRTT